MVARCLYPLVAEDLDPLDHPEAFELQTADPDPTERDPYLAGAFDDDNYDPNWPGGAASEVAEILEDPDHDDALEDTIDGQDQL